MKRMRSKLLLFSVVVLRGVPFCVMLLFTVVRCSFGFDEKRVVMYIV